LAAAITGLILQSQSNIAFSPIDQATCCLGQKNHSKSKHQDGIRKRKSIMFCEQKPLSGQEKVTQEWNGMAGEWDDLAAGYRDGFVKLLWEETGYLDPASRKDLVVLDFGCGTSLLSEVIRKHVANVIGVDVSPAMIEVSTDKIKAGGWENVEAHVAVLSSLDKAAPEVKEVLNSLKGKVDIIAASSVLSFIPDEDVEATMKVLGELLKPGTGMLCHSDWPKSEEHPDGFTEENALKMYQQASLEVKTTKVSSIKMSSQEMAIFVGIAVKPA
jgi:2-polyprenyl-3-methyl-5-hydroxy-6-metoxy-1,4-benzoquinol methylase